MSRRVSKSRTVLFCRNDNQWGLIYYDLVVGEIVGVVGRWSGEARWRGYYLLFWKPRWVEWIMSEIKGWGVKFRNYPYLAHNKWKPPWLFGLKTTEWSHILCYYRHITSGMNSIPPKRRRIYPLFPLWILYACASYYTATVPAAAHPGHHEHLLEFTNPRIQNTLLVFSLCSPPLFHLLDLSLVLNLLERKLVSRVFN